MVVLATAHPAKFPEALAAAGLPPDEGRVNDLFGRSEQVDRISADAAAVKAYVRGWA